MLAFPSPLPVGQQKWPHPFPLQIHHQCRERRNRGRTQGNNSWKRSPLPGGHGRAHSPKINPELSFTARPQTHPSRKPSLLYLLLLRPPQALLVALRCVGTVWLPWKSTGPLGGRSRPSSSLRLPSPGVCTGRCLLIESRGF